MSEAMNRTRRTQWHKYLGFCEEYGLKPLPADPHQICTFLVSLAQQLKYSSINNYLSGIIMLHKLYVYQQDFRLDFRVVFTLRGLKRVLGNVSCRKSPRLPSDLRVMSGFVDFTELADQAVWACVVLAFRTLLRKSNLFPSGLDNSHCVRRKDITFTDWGMTLTISSSKTIQFKERSLVIPVVSAGESPLFAVHLVKEHWARSPT